MSFMAAGGEILWITFCDLCIYVLVINLDLAPDHLCAKFNAYCHMLSQGDWSKHDAQW